eukprot:Opistho-2@48258
MATRLYVGRISRSTRTRDVERLCDRYGRLREVTMKDGFCFVEYYDDRDAHDAVRDLHGRDFMGDRLIVEYARGAGSHGAPRQERRGPLRRTDHAVIVENLSTRASWQDLKDFMREAGEVIYVDAHQPRDGEGVVEFATADDMKNAIRKLDDTEFKEKRIRITEQPRRARSRSRSRSPRRRSSQSPAARERSPARERTRSPARERSPVRERSRSPAPDRSPPKEDAHDDGPADAEDDAPADDRRDDRDISERAEDDS